MMRIAILFYTYPWAFVGFLATCLFIVVGCLLGVIEFKWKSRLLRPLEEEHDTVKAKKEVGDFLVAEMGHEFEVFHFDGAFHISTSSEFHLSDEVIVSSLTAAFPRFVFRIHRALSHAAAN